MLTSLNLTKLKEVVTDRSQDDGPRVSEGKPCRQTVDRVLVHSVGHVEQDHAGDGEIEEEFRPGGDRRRDGETTGRMGEIHWRR